MRRGTAVIAGEKKSQAEACATKSGGGINSRGIFELRKFCSLADARGRGSGACLWHLAAWGEAKEGSGILRRGGSEWHKGALPPWSEAKKDAGFFAAAALNDTESERAVGLFRF